MVKKQLILIALFLSLIASSFFIKSIEEKPNRNDIKGDTTDICIEIEDSAREQLGLLNIPRDWYVKSPDISEDTISFSLDLPSENVTLNYDLNGIVYDAIYQDSKWLINIPINTLESNEYRLIVRSKVCESEMSKSFTFKVSNPVYVVWSIDWEGFDVKEDYLKEMSRVSSQYNVPMTHFFNPYIYLYLSPSRSQYLTNWVKNREGESIGLHLHMYNKLVEASGVEVNNNPSWGSPTGNGHDTPNSNYGYDDYKKIIEWSINQFQKNNLGTPKMYRAGGWFIDEENIKVLNTLGFEIESSGRTYYIHGRNQIKGHWNLTETTQPYQMNSNDQNITNNPNINIWQYPNNGGDSWAFNSEGLIARFKANYTGNIANEDIVVTYLSHPHWFDKEGPNIEEALKYVSKYTYSSDNGPVIFITLDKVYQYTVKQ